MMKERDQMERDPTNHGFLRSKITIKETFLEKDIVQSDSK